MDAGKRAVLVFCGALVACSDKGLDLPTPGRMLVSAGFDFSCLHRPDGTIACWGDDSSGQASGAPEGTFAQIATGWERACGVRTEGTLACWGAPDGQEPDPPPDGHFTSVAVGHRTACALDPAGEITCWGCEWVCVTPDCGESEPGGIAFDCWESDEIYRNTNNYELRLPRGPFSRIELEEDLNGCALSEAGELECWGPFRGTPPSGPLTAFSLGASHGCALDSHGELACWNDAPDYFASPPEGAFVMVSVGGHQTAVLDEDGAITVWSLDPEPTPFPILTDVPSGAFEHIDLGDDHGCAVDSDSRIECWGDSPGATPPP